MRTGVAIAMFVLFPAVAGAPGGCGLSDIPGGYKPLPPDQRPPAWAQPVQIEGVENCFRVSPALYRGAQPDEAALQRLKETGIHTVVNLRSLHGEGSEVQERGLEYVHFYMKTYHPEDEEVVSFLQVVTDPARQPVFVHCQHGADRTGAMVAIYRIAVEGWSKEEALREMTRGGFGFFRGWGRLESYIRKLDVGKIKARAGIP